MTPADFREWWLAVAAMSASVSTAALAAEPEQAGIIDATQGTTHSLGIAGQQAEDRVVYLGDKTYRYERLKNDGDGQTHLLFLDQSSMTMGPDSEIVLDEFTYDPGTKKGKIAVSMVKGLLRVVGGDISKSNETEIKTPVGTIGIRGGITLVEHNGQQMRGTFLFGQQMRASRPDGTSTTINRPGFGITITPQGLGQPLLVTPGQLATLTQRLEARPQEGQSKPGPAPAGQLLSTGGQPGAISNPGATIGPNRLDNSSTISNTANPQRSVTNVLGGSSTPTSNLRTIVGTTLKVKS